jgi:hypothetical protein
MFLNVFLSKKHLKNENENAAFYFENCCNDETNIKKLIILQKRSRLIEFMFSSPIPHLYVLYFNVNIPKYTDDTMTKEFWITKEKRK